MNDDSRDEGCLCEGCGRRYRVDVTLDDDLWYRVSRSGELLLCGPCIMERIERQRAFDHYELVHRG